MLSELETIDNQIRALKYKAAKIRSDLKPLHYELNDIPLQQFRANRLKISTVKKEVANSKQQNTKKMSKIKVTVDPKQITAKKLLVAAGFSGVDVLSSEVVSPKKTSHTLNFSRGEELLEMGGYLATLTDDEVTKELERRDKAAEKKAAEAKKK